MLDQMMRDSTRGNPNTMVPWYLMASYAYYVLDDPILSDSEFDRLAISLLVDWDEIEHQHKYLITEGDLEAGTLLNRNFPQITMDTTLRLIHDTELLREVA